MSSLTDCTGSVCLISMGMVVDLCSTNDDLISVVLVASELSE